jgi:hypothetical protein
MEVASGAANSGGRGAEPPPWPNDCVDFPLPISHWFDPLPIGFTCDLTAATSRSPPPALAEGRYRPQIASMMAPPAVKPEPGAEPWGGGAGANPPRASSLLRCVAGPLAIR